MDIEGVSVQQFEFITGIIDSFTYEVVFRVTLEIIMDGRLWSYGARDSFLRETHFDFKRAKERREIPLFEAAITVRVMRRDDTYWDMFFCRKK